MRGPFIRSENLYDDIIILICHNKIRKGTTRQSKILSSKRLMKELLKCMCLGLRSTRKKELVSWLKGENIFMISLIRGIKTVWPLPEFIKVPWSITRGWRKCRPAISTMLWKLSKLLEVVAEAQIKLRKNIINDQDSYRNLLKKMIVEGMIKMLEPIIYVRYLKIYLDVWIKTHPLSKASSQKPRDNSRPSLPKKECQKKSGTLTSKLTVGLT